MTRRPARARAPGRRHREVDDEARAGVRVLEVDAAAVRLRHGADDREPQPGTSAVALAAHEALEDVIAQLVGDAGPVVLDGQHDLAVARPTPACTRVPGGVWRIAFSIRFSAIRCSSSRGRRRSRVGVDRERRGRRRPGRARRRRRRAPGRRRSAVGDCAVGVGAREQQRSPTRRRIRCDERSADSAASRRSPSSTSASSSRFARIARQWRAQLVRGVGDELALARERVLGLGAGGLEVVEHLLERAPEPADLVVGARARKRAAGVAGLGDVAGAGGQRRDRRAWRGAPSTTPPSSASSVPPRTPPARNSRTRQIGRLDVRDLTSVLDDDRYEQRAVAVRRTLRTGLSD